MFKEQIETVLTQDMDRKKFFQYAGTVILSAIGVTGLVQLILSSRNTSSLGEKTNAHAEQTSGYGGSNYGKE